MQDWGNCALSCPVTSSHSSLSVMFNCCRLVEGKKKKNLCKWAIFKTVERIFLFHVLCSLFSALNHNPCMLKKNELNHVCICVSFLICQTCLELWHSWAVSLWLNTALYRSTGESSSHTFSIIPFLIFNLSWMIWNSWCLEDSESCFPYEMVIYRSATG